MMKMFPAKQEMTDAAHRHCTRPWYLRPPVWVLGVVLLGLAVFGIMGAVNRPAAMPYSDFLDQLDAGNVASVTFQGTRINGRFKHAIVAPAVNGAAPRDTFRTQVPDVGDPTLLPELRGEHVAIGVGSQGLGFGTIAILGVLGAFLLGKPMLLVIAGAFIVGLIGVLRGRKMDIHSILSTLPMFRSVPGHRNEGSEPDGDSPRAGNRSVPME
jgi:FtsH Extracellular